MQRGGQTPKIDDKLIQRVWAEGELPSPAQQADTLVQLIAERDAKPIERLERDPATGIYRPRSMSRGAENPRH